MDGLFVVMWQTADGSWRAYPETFTDKASADRYAETQECWSGEIKVQYCTEGETNGPERVY